MTEVLAAADPAHPEGGHAVLLLRGVAEPPADARFRLLREGWTKGTLGPEGWQVGDALLSPDRVEPSPQGVRLYLGPHIVDWLEAGPVQFRLPRRASRRRSSGPTSRRCMAAAAAPSRARRLSSARPPHPRLHRRPRRFPGWTRTRP